MIADDDGYRLWMRYEPIADPRRLAEYRLAVDEIALAARSPTLRLARDELAQGVAGLLGRAPAVVAEVRRSHTIVAGTPDSSAAIHGLGLAADLAAVGREGFLIRRPARAREDLEDLTVIAAQTDVGVLYGVFAFLRHLQTQQSLSALDMVRSPKKSLRMLDHWDNLDGSIERGYAGTSIWHWNDLPARMSPRIHDYGRACASIAINAVALTNVNANAVVLTAPYLRKVAALADVLRPFGIRTYLTARFSAPIEIGGLATADPLDAGVRRWWTAKCREIHALIPDFGGFVVKASSEGQPGPQDYGRNHADGANLFADALAASGDGIVLWRAFVYHEAGGEDRAKQAFAELVPLDGAFRANVMVQVKNGAIDFQPREPFHPLFGAMPRTSLLVEFQITQEYLGHGTHLAYLAPLFAETLDADTHTRAAGAGPGASSHVADIVSGLAGVANVGSDRNWCGHPFAQANWYAFGRLAFDPHLGADLIADEWLRMTFSNDDRFVAPAKAMMLGSREAVVDYMTPLGLHHLMAKDHHFGPGPWVDTGRADWTSVYYHRADAAGIGFDRTSTGSDAVAQYHAPWPSVFGSLASCPERLLLWFHHVPWAHRMRSGHILWDELCLRYQRGVDFVRKMRATWTTLGPYVDQARFGHVKALLAVQEDEACWWRDACVLYFQTFSRRAIPTGCEPPRASLELLRTEPRAPPIGHQPP